MDKEQIIALLNEDLEGEHGAIIQYLTHAYAMGEGEMSCEIEAIAREEMRHLDWLAEAIVELGGAPRLTRGNMRLGNGEVANWMANNVLLEEDAINLYKKHLEMIDDPKIKRLIQRIISDEQSHHHDFQHFQDKAKREGARDVRGNASDETTKVIDWGIAHEYTVILQYMFHSYMTKNREAKQQLEDQAINEMQHLGWLAEELVDRDGTPAIEHTEVNQSLKTGDMLRADIGIEKKVAAEYDRAAKATKEDKLKRLFLRLRDNEVYHASVFRDLLKDEEKNPSD
jgi:bacterioferritin